MITTGHQSPPSQMGEIQGVVTGAPKSGTSPLSGDQGGFLEEVVSQLGPEG